METLKNTGQTKSNQTRVDPLAKALGILQEKVKLGYPPRKLVDLVTKKGGELAFRKAIMTLIEAGWCEYEFTNDYRGVRRLDLPDFARGYYKELRNIKNEQSKHNDATRSKDDSGASIKSILGKISGSSAA